MSTISWKFKNSSAPLHTLSSVARSIDKDLVLPWADLFRASLQPVRFAWNFLNKKPKLWKRYVDNVLELVKEGSVQQLKDHLNQTEPTGNIQLTHESENDGQIPFLDTLITCKPDGTVKLLIIIQKTHPYRPIFELWFQPLTTAQTWLRLKLEHFQTELTG